MRNQYGRLLAACQKVTNDPMAYVTAWKTRTPNGKAVGFFPTYVPTEIVYAVGGLPVGLWGGSISTGSANAYIQQFTCSIVRSTTEYALEGTLDRLDAVLFPPICDSAKLVGSIWSLNLAGKFLVDMVNLPERLDSKGSAPYLAAELRRVHAALAARFGLAVSEDALWSGIASADRLRKAQQDFSVWRSQARSCGTNLVDAATILRAGTIMHVDEYVPLLEEMLAQPDHEAPKPSQGVPVALTGLACQLPHAEFLALFESAGLRVIEDDLFLGMRAALPAATAGDPYCAIAEAFVNSAAMAMRHNSGVQRHEQLLDRIKQRGGKGVVFLVPKFCEPEWFDVRYLQAETKKASIPSIIIDFEEGAGMTGPVQTRLEAFAETIA